VCGLAGLSIGCQMAPSCPKRLLQPRSETARRNEDEIEGSGPLASWPGRASVRTRPHPRLGSDHNPGFPLDFVPVAGHDLVTAANAEVHRLLAARHLFRYLHFTAKLEHLVVNRTALALAHDETGFRLPTRMRLDAFKIYCDEAYHALVAAELAEDVVRRTGLDVDWRSRPYFLTRLGELCEQAGKELAPLLEILFVVCSETLISGTLTEAAGATGLSEPVRQTLQDHAHDERRHHAYFAELLTFIWSELTDAARHEVGVFVPRLVDAFLLPDLEDQKTELGGYGFRADDVERILEETYPPDLLGEQRRRVARHTIRYFERVGALEDPGTADAFHRAGLIVAV
jgi:hypothetical protein